MSAATRRFLVASDFDQTLSFNDSGLVLADLLGVRHFERKVLGLSQSNLVQQGGELAYLIRHDPEFRRVRREDLIEAGRRVRLKTDIPALIDFLRQGVDEAEFVFVVISAAPRDVVEAALDGMVPPEHIFATEFAFDADSGEVVSVERVPAGYGKVAVIEELKARFDVPAHRVIYVGDGSSDVHVMLHVNHGDGFTIAVSENKQLAQIARRTVLSEHASSVMVPVLGEVFARRPGEVRELFEARGLTLRDWAQARTDRVTVDAIAATDDVSGSWA